MIGLPGATHRPTAGHGHTSGPGSGPYPPYILPNGGGVAQGYPLISDRLAPAYQAEDMADFGYPQADSGPMPAYRPLQGGPAWGYRPADNRAAFEYQPVDGKRILGWLPFGNRLVLLPRGTQFGGDQELREHRDVSGGARGRARRHARRQG